MKRTARAFALLCAAAFLPATAHANLLCSLFGIDCPRRSDNGSKQGGGSNQPGQPPPDIVVVNVNPTPAPYYPPPPGDPGAIQAPGIGGGVGRGVPGAGAPNPGAGAPSGANSSGSTGFGQPGGPTSDPGAAQAIPAPGATDPGTPAPDPNAPAPAPEPGMASPDRAMGGPGGGGIIGSRGIGHSLAHDNSSGMVAEAGATVKGDGSSVNHHGPVNIPSPEISASGSTGDPGGGVSILQPALDAPTLAASGAPSGTGGTSRVPTSISGPAHGGGTADLLSRSAASKLRLGDLQGAVKEATRALNAGAHGALTYGVRAEAQNRLKQYDKAYADATMAVASDPKDPRGYQNLSWAALKLKKYDEALKAADMAIRLNPNDGNSYAMRAYAKEMLGDHKGAVADLETAALLDRRFSEKLAAVKDGAKVYDPDEESTLGDTVAGAASPNKLMRNVGLGLGGLAAAALALFAGIAFGRRRKEETAAAPTLAGLAPTPVENGRRALGKYKMLRVMGRGGMGTVHEALDTSLNRPVAVKRLSQNYLEKDTAGRETMLKEARTVASLHHPAIVDIYELIEADELYLVFEFVNGRTLHQLIAEQQKVPLKRAVEIIKPVCEALDFAHSRGLVHRDLKPANVMITELGHVKLMDFGIARSMSDAAAPVPVGASVAAEPKFDPLRYAQTRTIMGTGPYMGPESSEGIVCKEGDVYAAGVTLYEMLTGAIPFNPMQGGADKIKLAYKPASTLVPGLPKAVDAVIEKALQPKPEARYRSAKDFVAALEAAAQQPAS